MSGKGGISFALIPWFDGLTTNVGGKSAQPEAVEGRSASRLTRSMNSTLLSSRSST